MELENIPVMPQSWSGYLLTALVGVCLWIVKGFKSDMKEMKEAQSEFVTREEVSTLMKAADGRAKESEARQLTMHGQNSDNFREVRLQLESVNNKLFELAKAKEP